MCDAIFPKTIANRETVLWFFVLIIQSTAVPIIAEPLAEATRVVPRALIQRSLAVTVLLDLLPPTLSKTIIVPSCIASRTTPPPLRRTRTVQCNVVAHTQTHTHTPGLLFRS